MKSSQIIYPPYNIDSLLEKANEELDCLINELLSLKVDIISFNSLLNQSIS